MFKFSRKPVFSGKPVSAPVSLPSPVMVEGLEDRRLLSVSPALGFRLGGSDLGAGHGIHARGASIEFSQAPTAVQNGIKSLATAQSLTAPTDTTSVFLGNSNGVETYTVLLSTTGTTPTTTRLTVDVSGNAVTAPTRSTTTFGAINNAAVTNRINAIANPQLPKVGERFLGTVVKTAAFGAFVSLLPGKDGLLRPPRTRR